MQLRKGRGSTHEQAAAKGKGKSPAKAEAASHQGRDWDHWSAGGAGRSGEAGTTGVAIEVGIGTDPNFNRN